MSYPHSATAVTRRRLAWSLAIALLAAAGCDAAPAEPDEPAPAPTSASKTPSAPAGKVVNDVAASLPPGTFEAVTPCTPGAPPLPQIPGDADCEMAIWRVDLGVDGTYELRAAYGMSQPNTPGIRGGGTPIAMAGTWSASNSPNTAGVTVIELADPSTSRPVRFRMISDDLIHLLDDGGLMVGNGAWSYTLSRTGPAGEQQASRGADESVPAPASPPDVTGTYEGRTRCSPLVHEFTRIPEDPGCQRIKWWLRISTSDGDPAQGTYLFQGTETERRGTWRLAQGAGRDPSAVVVELDLDTSDPLRLLAADANHLYVLDRDRVPLVGDALFSYTLSRAAAG